MNCLLCVQRILPVSGESEEAPPPPQIPEPSAAYMERLTGMGFSEELVRKALLMHRNSLEVCHSDGILSLEELNIPCNADI